MSRIRYGVLSSLVFLLAACATPHPRRGEPAGAPSESEGARENVSSPLKARGLASWYGSRSRKKKRARKTANGERFDALAMTAAHRTLPFGTRVKVRELNTGKEVIVRINDRGPHKKGRIIDLSYAAGRSLGILGAGVARVEIEVL